MVQETLRLHPPVQESPRVSVINDIVSLGETIKTATGATVDKIHIAKGEVVNVPIGLMNCSEALWGSDAKEFNPDRWITDGGLPPKAQEIQGHRHLLTFLDGPRIYLGRGLLWLSSRPFYPS